MKYENSLNVFSIIVAIIAVLISSIKLLFDAPGTTNEPININVTHTQKTILNPKCCIFTTFSKQQIQNLLLLGFSIHTTGRTPPKSFAFNTGHELSNKERNLILPYFEIINSPESANEVLVNNECFPVLSVSVKGVFNKTPWDVCDYDYNISLPAAVPKHSVILYPDQNLLLIDPKQNHSGSFSLTHISDEKWSPLPGDLHVNDYNNTFLDFWTRYGNPTYISYSSETYQNLVAHRKKNPNGGFRIYRILQRIYKDWQISFEQNT